MTDYFHLGDILELGSGLWDILGVVGVPRQLQIILIAPAAGSFLKLGTSRYASISRRLVTH